LEPDRAIPSTIWRWARTNTIGSGAAARVDAATRLVQPEEYWPLNWLTSSGMVNFSSLLRKISGEKKLFHCPRKVKIPSAVSSVRSRGRTTVRKIRGLPAPSPPGQPGPFLRSELPRLALAGAVRGGPHRAAGEL